MNMQKILQEAQKMKKELENTQKEIESSIYDGNSSLVNVKLNGKYEVISVAVNLEEDIKIDDKEIIEDMILIAVNDAVKKINNDKKNKMGKYGQGLTGLM